MRKSTYLLYFLLLTMVVGINGSCEAQANKKEKSSYNKKEARVVSSFSSLDLSIAANVYLRQGETQSVELEGDVNDLEKILTEVSGSELKIKTRTGSWNLDRIDVYITMKEINNLAISGSGSIKAETGIKTNKLGMVISGSGNINIPDLSAANTSSVISGSGNITYAGSSVADNSSIVVTGSGNVNAEGLCTKDAKVTITGSGDCNVNASEKISAQVTGSGNVNYKGEALIDANVTGSGKIRKM